ncbi:hypothetical protein EON81_06215 [bacterium]|nr:MAG: hypothetical protein EON81_06215 [bacterium]
MKGRSKSLGDEKPRRRLGCAGLVVLLTALTGVGVWRNTRPELLQFDFIKGHAPLAVQTSRVNAHAGVSFEYAVTHTYVLPTENGFFPRAEGELRKQGYALRVGKLGPGAWFDWQRGDTDVFFEAGRPRSSTLKSGDHGFKVEPAPGWVTVSISEEDKRHEWTILAEDAIRWVGRGFKSE